MSAADEKPLVLIKYSFHLNKSDSRKIEMKLQIIQEE